MVYPLLLLLDASLASKNVWSEYAFQHFQSVLGGHNFVEFGHISSQILQHPLALSQDNSGFFSEFATTCFWSSSHVYLVYAPLFSCKIVLNFDV